jgi:hypothetical protein
MSAMNELCLTCKNYYHKNIGGGFKEILCTKYGGIPDEWGGHGNTITRSRELCKGVGYEFTHRYLRGKILVKPALARAMGKFGVKHKAVKKPKSKVRTIIKKK